ncbi:MAG: hypothetical protein R3344_15525, partial [Acidobacteriota bacterium]|nr:hypothetical protein [Acidobacteriota bacterium]
MMPVPPLRPATRSGLRRTHATLAVTLGSAFLAAACGSEEEAAAPVVDVRVQEVSTRDVPITREWAAQTFGIQD